jgi:hypothetical protein
MRVGIKDASNNGPGELELAVTTYDMEGLD